MVCTFFGHRNCPKEIESILHSTILDLIVNKNVTEFYVGNHGDFDSMARRILINLSKLYPIKYTVVLAYMPRKKSDPEDENPDDTLLPDGMESTPPKFAIDRRNRWMLKQSDYVVTYVRHSVGGAARYKELAEKQKKFIINLWDNP